jgi:hypothetical protein
MGFLLILKSCLRNSFIKNDLDQYYDHLDISSVNFIEKILPLQRTWVKLNTVLIHEIVHVP